MAELLKNYYNQDFFDTLCTQTVKVIPDFDRQRFLSEVIDKSWKNLELKQRMNRVASVYRSFLSPQFPVAVEQLLKVVDYLKKAEFRNLFPFIFIPDILEKYGLDFFDISVNAMEKITQLVSCEFAVRQFLIKYPENMMDQMLKWSLSENLHVRRLASEGCRPRLPWAMAVPFLKKDYSGILPVLENLKNDPSEYVRRSVANNLNDISRDFPEVVLNLAARWQGVTPETDKILKHACRTMIKKGNDNCLKIFGFSDKSALAGEKFQLNRKQFELNDTLEFDFSFTAKNDFSVRLQYIVDYVKSNGKSGPKVFFLGERTVKKGEGFAIRKKVKLAEYTTRKLYEGKHKISIMVNGVTVAEEWFFLKIDR